MVLGCVKNENSKRESILQGYYAGGGASLISVMIVFRYCIIVFRYCIVELGQEQKSLNLAFILTAYLNGIKLILKLGLHHLLLFLRQNFYQLLALLQNLSLGFTTQ